MAIAASFPSADLYLGLAECLGARGDVRGAERTLLDAKRVEPGNPVVEANLGLAALAQGRTSNAIDALCGAVDRARLAGSAIQSGACVRSGRTSERSESRGAHAAFAAACRCASARGGRAPGARHRRLALARGAYAPRASSVADAYLFCLSCGRTATSLPNSPCDSSSGPAVKNRVVGEPAAPLPKPSAHRPSITRGLPSVPCRNPRF